jgi:hypothetical protein
LYLVPCFYHDISFLCADPAPSAGTVATRFSLNRIRTLANIFPRLAARKRCPVTEFDAALDVRASVYGKAPHSPMGSTENIGDGVFYVEDINSIHHRTYIRKA